MSKTLLFVVLNLLIVSLAAAQELTTVRQVPHGMLCRLDGTRNVLLLKGTPSEMGTAHGQLMKKELYAMYERIALVAAGYAFTQSDWFFDRIAEIQKRSSPFIPERFRDEMTSLAIAAGLTPEQVYQINAFPELFHCSGLAVCGKASSGRQVLHVRVLDYMRGIGLQKYATLIVSMPTGTVTDSNGKTKKLNAWLSVSYPGFIGSVTAMNEKGLAMGEMGGRGEGKWDGLPMSFLFRRIMEECSTTDEAIALMKAVPLTCDYYYILSDADGSLAAIEAIAGAKEPVRVMRPGESDKRLPGALDDVVYISAPGIHANTLFARLKEHYGRIDAELLKKIIVRPVAASSNLHNAIFQPETLDIHFAEAGEHSPACDEKYYKTNLKTLIEYYQKAVP
ncbi:MAG: C45 family autoproteolytic acyltransferase/hydrolase [Thermoguttaceae bacterium]|nr:C45 family autoproteolytic acyltransferase/hydrolase [Thermoguttaceae bacterium]